MKISDIGEFGLIERIRKMMQNDARGVRVGIGDDAAILGNSAHMETVATTDMLVEGVHFDLRTTDLYSLGWKSAAVNLSDIAAMGGIPRYCLAAIGIPATLDVDSVRKFYQGMQACLKRCKTTLVGGDTCHSPSGLIIGITVLGEAKRKQALTRDGARPGDLIFVTGTLGDSSAGLELLQQGARDIPDRTVRGQVGQGSGKGRSNSSARLIERHLRPEPRVSEGKKIARVASAMIDVSDGLSSDLGHICEQSRVGAVIQAEQLPLSRAVTISKTLKCKPVEYALSGGEDYELLFTVAPEKVGRLKKLNVEITEIGRIIKGSKMILVAKNGKRTPLRPTGYDHFREKMAGQSVRR